MAATSGHISNEPSALAAEAVTKEIETFLDGRPLNDNRNSFLVCVDGSDRSRSALDYIISHKIVRKGDVVVVLAVMHDDKDSTREFVATAANETNEAGYSAVGVCVSGGGKAKEVICHVAETQGFTFVSMGARGKGAVMRFFLGSVTQYVLAHCNSNVIITKPSENVGGRVLLCADRSAHSQSAFERYLAIASKEHTLNIMGVHKPYNMPSTDVAEMSSVIERINVQALAELEESLNTLEAAATAAGLSASVVVREGEPRKTITDFIAQNNIDLLIVGARDASTLAASYVGSVSSYLVSYADVSAVVVFKSGTPDPILPPITEENEG